MHRSLPAIVKLTSQCFYSATQRNFISQSVVLSKQNYTQKAAPISIFFQRWYSTKKESSEGTPKPQSNLCSEGDEPLLPGKATTEYRIWTEDQLKKVNYKHRPPKGFVDHLALYTIKLTRFNFDIISGYKLFKQTEETWLNRIVFLETVAGVPGSIAATLRHLASLRRMKRDHGWIHTLLEEAENERMHLLTALELKKPGKMFRLAVMISQGIFYNFFFVSYLISPRFCHRLVGYLEEEAVATYTKCLEELDKGNLPKWKKTPAPDIAKRYWKLKDSATMYDVITVIRADEANHRDVNHTLAGLKMDDVNPFSLKK